MPTPKTPFPTVMQDVRRAYRLLHDYQRMVLDGVAYLGKQMGLTYVGGWPKFSSVTPRAGKGGLQTHWAWDWLNLMQHDFHFQLLEEKTVRAHVSMLLISDTGYFFSERDHLVKTDVADFLPAEKSQTLLGFIIARETWGYMGFMEDREGMRKFILNGELPPHLRELGMIGLCYDLAELETEAKASVLADKVVAKASAAGVPLSRHIAH